MVTKSDINRQLERPIIKNTVFDKLMPYSDCSSINLGTGNTQFGVQSMKKWVLKYAYHTELLAPQLKKQTLKLTCKNTHNFLFNHLQYKIDEDIQQLRSPACSWASRFEGLDCKSFTIFASTILYNLGINHYIRRIKKQKRQGFSHVYVVVPANQQSNSKESYYIIDGTLPIQTEGVFYQSDDVLIQGKQATKGLAGASETMEIATQQFTDEAQQLVKMRAAQIKAGYAAITGAVSSVVGGVLMATGVGAVVGGVFMAVSAVVGLAINLLADPCHDAFYDAKEIGTHLQEDFLPNLKRCLQECQKQADKGIIEGTIGTLNTLLFEIDLGVAHFNSEKNTHNGNACSKQALVAYTNYVQGIKDVVDSLYDAFVTMLGLDYDVKEINMQGNTGQRTWFFIVPVTHNPVEAKYRRLKVGVKTDNPHVAYPYDSDKTFKQWLDWNKTYFRVENICSPARIQEYYNKVLPYGTKIKDVRSNYFLPAIYRLDEEAKLRSEMRVIYLQFDDKYKEELKQKSNALVEKTLLAQKTFLNELSEIKKNKIADAKQNIENLNAILKARKTKMIVALVTVGVVSTVIIKKIM